MQDVLGTRDPLTVVTEMVTAVSQAPEHLPERVEALVDILIPELRASVGLLVRADLTRLDLQLLGHPLTAGAHAHLSQQLRRQLTDPLLAPVLLGDLRPTTAARAFGPDHWRASSARASAMVTFGVDQVATLPIHGGGSDVAVLLIGREGPDFTEEDLTLIRAVQPVVTGLGRLLRLPWRSQPAPPSRVSDRPELTHRETEVLSLLAHGYKAAVIARKAGCSTRTVQRHLGNIYDKLGVSDRLSAVNRAHTLGVIADDIVDTG